MPTLEDVLGIRLGASQAEIRSAYRRLALKWHPDKPGGDEDRFKATLQAYEHLMKQGSGQILSPESFRRREEQYWAERANEVGPSDDTLLLMRAACLKGDVEEIARLLATGMDVGVADESGLWPLAYACMRGHDAAARLLLDLGSAVDQSTRAGVTALMETCRAGKASCAAILLERGAPVDQTNRTGHTALMFACIGVSTLRAHACTIARAQAAAVLVSPSAHSHTSKVPSTLLVPPAGIRGVRQAAVLARRLADQGHQGRGDCGRLRSKAAASSHSGVARRGVP